MNNSPLVSVAVITYNQENTIAQTIDCILNQNRTFDIEIIIGEDCSVDNTREICINYQEKYPEIIKLILHEKNQGLLKNYQSVIEASKGKYIAGCAGDDYWHNPDKLKLQVDFLETNTDYGLVHSNAIILYVATLKKEIRKASHIPVGNVFNDLLITGNFIIALTVMFRRNLLEHINLSEYKELGFMMEDYPMWIEMSYFTKFYYINEPLVTYRLHKNSMSHFDDYNKNKLFLENMILIRQYFCSKYLNKINYQQIEDDFNWQRLSLAFHYRNKEDINTYSKCVRATIKLKMKKYLFQHIATYKLYKILIKIRSLLKKV